MNFSQFLLILFGRRKLVLLMLIVTVTTALAISLLQSKSYKATATLVLNYKGTDPVTGLTLSGQLMPSYMATQADIISSKNVALKVIDELKLADDPRLKKAFKQNADGGSIRDWLAARLAKKLDVTPSRESGVLDIGFSGANPQFAAAAANAFARAYQQTSMQLNVEPLRKASSYFNEQTKVLRDSLEKAQNRMSRYQQEHGIVSVDKRLDVESARLNDLSSQLVAVQGQMMEAASRSREARGREGIDSPDVMANPLIQNLKASLAQAQAKFSYISQRLTPNHPQYQSAQEEIEKLRSALSSNIQATLNSVSSNARILHRHEVELQAAVEVQKNKVLGLNRARDELALLGRDVESAQRAYDATVQRFNQTSLEGQSNQTDVAILNDATPPLEPSSPKILLNILVSALLGTILGIFFSVLAELFDRRLRSSKDLADLLNAPMFAVARCETRKIRRFAIIPAAGFRALTYNRKASS